MITFASRTSVSLLASAASRKMPPSAAAAMTRTSAPALTPVSPVFPAVAATPAVVLGASDAVVRHFHSPAVRRYNRKKRTEPSVEMAKNMMATYPEMDNRTLITIAQMDNHEARSEVLKRHIMAVDNVSYTQANRVFDRMAAKNREGGVLASLPYFAGAGISFVAGIASIPLVFDLNTAAWFNEHFVTTDVPEASDLETWLEVGSWTWNWMEPPLGQVSFFLLCLQFSRAQVMNLGIRPYTSKLKHMRSKRLSTAFPQYDAKIVEAFSETDQIFPDPFETK